MRVRALRDGRIVGRANQARLIARDGTERPIEHSGAPIRDSTGQLMGVVVMFQDITERSKAEAALQASHDQFAVILQGVADGIVAETPEGQLAYANEAAAQVIGYPSVQAMLAVTSRIEMGQLSIESAALDICALVRRVVGEVQPTVDDRTIELHCSSAPIIVAGDEVRLEQVLQNLLISGMGIGLYVVKEIMMLHGDGVSVESTEGSGSTFTVWLPAASNIDAPEQEPGAHQPGNISK